MHGKYLSVLVCMWFRAIFVVPIEYLCISSLFGGLVCSDFYFSVHFHRYFYHSRFICGMWSILCGRLFYHFDCIPRCARHCNQCTRFKSKLCKHFNGHRWYGNVDNGHSGTVFGWRAHTKCKFCLLFCYHSLHAHQFKRIEIHEFYLVLDLASDDKHIK